MSWNAKFQESNEWKSKVRDDDDCYCYYNEEDSDDVEVDEDEACSRKKKVVPDD